MNTVLNEIFGQITKYGGVASGAYFTTLCRGEDTQAAIIKAWTDSEAQPNRARTAEIVNILLGRGLRPGGANPGERLKWMVRWVASRSTVIVNGWGRAATFNAATDTAWGKPLLIHAFGATKQITPGTTIYELLKAYIAPELASSAERGSAISRPALKLLRDPGCLKGNIVSASLINQQKRPAAGVAGYILQASAWNIIGAYRADANLLNDDLRRAKPIHVARTHSGKNAPIQLGESRGNLPNISMQSITELLHLTVGTDGPNQYNEVALQGTSAFDTEIQVSGIFVKVRQVGAEYKLLDLAEASLYRDAPTMFLYSQSVVDAIKEAVAGGLPLVAIVDNNTNLYASARSLNELGSSWTMLQ